MKSKGHMLKLLLGFAVLAMFGVMPQVLADEADGISTSDIIALVEQLDQEGEFANESSVRALKMHLTAVNHYEKQGEADKVVQHMNSFKLLLGHQLDNELITEHSFTVLSDKTDALIQSYDPEPETVSIVQEGQSNAVIVVSEESGKPLGNIAGWNRYGTKGNEIIYPSSEKSYSGFYSLNINHEDDGSYYSTLSHGIRVSEGDVFNASAKVYIEERGDGSRDHPYFSISFYDERGNNIQNNVGTWTADEKKDGWFEGSAITGVMPENAYTVRVLVRAMPNGSFYLDDVELTREGNEENLLTNPGFEINPIANSAANTLIEYVQKSSGVQLPVISSEPTDIDEMAIYVGLSAAEDEARHQALLSELNEHGYIIDVQDDRITIVGNTSVATQYGVSEFLETYLGVRWLMPGPDGEHVPQHNTIAIPKELVEDEPAAISRHFFSGGNPAFTAWYSHNRMIHNIQFHHNMNNLFSPSVFADRPELYAGDVVPTDASSWQPKFNEETAQVAIQRIIEYFDANPNATSYSLGINDGTKYHEVPGNEYLGVLFEDKRNSTGSTHRTDYYARWMNIVAEGVAEEYPDKYLGFLAYREMQDPPKNPDGSTYKLHPNLVPYITLDRMMWANPEFKQNGQEHVEAWHESAENLGWYDYMYGAAYSLPRIYFNLMDENYKFAQDQGIIGHVAELYPNFAGEGPKAWLASKLQWDPEQDVDALLDDWYVSAVGEEAAPYLREYYEFWEAFWTERILDSNWFPSLPRVYLDFNNLTYLRELTREELYAQQDLLLQVLDHAETEAQKVRAQYFLEGFEYYETSFLSYPLANDVEVEIPANEEEALEMLNRAIESYEMAQRRLEIPDEFFPDPILRHYGSNRGFWDGIQPKYIEALEAYVAENEPDGGAVTEPFNQFLQDIGYIAIEANAYRTEASKEDIMASLDFSQGPWENAVAVDQFYIINSKVEPPAETKVRLLWDDDYIYVGYENFDDDLSGLISGDLAGSGFWWASGQDDSNETYITANPDEAFLGFFSNPEGNKFVRPRTIPADYVEPEWDYSASIGEDRWTAIQAIPFDLIGVDDPNETSSLHAIFFRSYHGASAYIGWEGGAPWNPAGFNTVNLVH